MAADLLDAAQVAQAVAGHDAVISAYNPGWSEPKIYELFLQGSQAIVEGVKAAGVERLLVVGGVGSLYGAPGVQLVDTPEFPAEYKQGALAARELLSRIKQETTLDWSFVSPPIGLAAGQRSGKYRLGADDLLPGQGDKPAGISVPDLAVAIVDEVEQPAPSAAPLYRGELISNRPLAQSVRAQTAIKTIASSCAQPAASAKSPPNDAKRRGEPHGALPKQGALRRASDQRQIAYLLARAYAESLDCSTSRWVQAVARIPFTTELSKTHQASHWFKPKLQMPRTSGRRSSVIASAGLRNAGPAGAPRLRFSGQASCLAHQQTMRRQNQAPVKSPLLIAPREH